MQFRQNTLIAFTTAGLLLSLAGCQRASNDDANGAAQTAEVTPEAPAVEVPPAPEPFVVESVAGDESTQTNPADATPDTTADAETEAPDDDATAPDATATSTAPAPPAASASAPATDPLADAKDASSIKAGSFKASGNEPFWGFDVDDKMMVFRTLENQEGWMLPVKRSGDGNKLTYSGTHEGKAFSFSLVKRACVDSMSGQKFSYAVRGEVNGNKYDGCANAK